MRGMALKRTLLQNPIDRYADKSEPKNLTDVWNELLLPIGTFGIDCKQMFDGAAAD